MAMHNFIPQFVPRCQWQLCSTVWYFLCMVLVYVVTYSYQPLQTGMSRVRCLQVPISM